ncbi:MAG: 16S rRNA (cytosine(1402)-N(4))-methyltransferase, partial [Candidatus Omnitrophica bacterium]|nr:16S rRNA (cytosine(1402)-N(4))-methyltransferase [Candidatus Omnitrophota bacterium]
MPEALVMTVSAPRWHEPVMVDEVLARLDPRPGETIVDATAGTGGHGLAIAPRLLPGGLLIAVDQDEQAVALAGGRLAEFSPQARVLHGNFRDLPRLLQEQGLQAVDGLLLDLGVSSLHLEESERGFSFLREGPLDMRMDLSRGRPASS